ncbi:MAG: glycosyltransferase family 4 protein [Spartobacteria bacterium]|nr:glycosyltransferase family 4 protein [Spartobacteria bacterium]
MRLMIACRAIDNMAGGVERQALALANAMHTRGHDVCLFTLDGPQAEAFYPLARGISWFRLGLGNPLEKASWQMRFSRMHRVRRMLMDHRPDILLAFQSGMFFTMRAYGMGFPIPIVAAERESPYRFDHLKVGKYRSWLFQSMRLATRITVQCPSYIGAYPAFLRSRISVIPNAIMPAKQRASPQGDVVTRKTLLCVGRLGFQKNQLVLVHAFESLCKAFPDWRLLLVGEGDGRRDIEDAIRRLGLSERVELIGAVKDVEALYARSHALCIPSRWEGFPNVLGEAFAHGLPAVGYAGCGGVCDLIEHNKNGLLAQGNGDLESLRDALARLMTDAALRQKMGVHAVRTVELYAPSRVYDQWETFLVKTCGR